MSTHAVPGERVPPLLLTSADSNPRANKQAKKLKGLTGDANLEMRTEAFFASRQDAGMEDEELKHQALLLSAEYSGIGDAMRYSARGNADLERACDFYRATMRVDPDSSAVDGPSARPASTALANSRSLVPWRTARQG